MSASTALDQLLAPGDCAPAGAAVGIETGGSCDVSVRGWAVPPSAGRRGVPLRRSHLFDLASVTKAVCTTVILMKLIATDRVRLDDRAQRFLPEFRGDGKDRVTVRHLLTHTAGLQPWFPLYTAATDRAGALALAAALPLASRPGDAWRYSDLGFMLLGRLIERVLGTGLGTAFRTLVAAPLGLHARFGPVPSAQAAASADGDGIEYRMIASGEPYAVPVTPDDFIGWRRDLIRGEAQDGNASHALGGVSGHAGLFATIDDLLVLGSALAHGTLVPESTVAEFSQPTSIHPAQALGFRRIIHRDADGPVTVLWHGGYTGTLLAFCSQRRTAVAGSALRLLGNRSSALDEPAPGRPLSGDAICSILLNNAGLGPGGEREDSRP